MHRSSPSSTSSTAHAQSLEREDIEMVDRQADKYLDDVKTLVKKGVEEHKKKWNDSRWSDFIKEVVLFLRDKREEDDDVVATATGLIVFGATTLDKLKRIADNKKEFREALSAEEGVPKAICDLLFEKYVKGDADRKRSGSGESDENRRRKRQCIEQECTTPVENFFKMLHEGVENNGFIEFAAHILGENLFPSVLYVRECYEILSKGALEIVDDSTKKRAVVVMGTPGVGKTVCGLYVTYLLLQRNETVMYSLGVDGRGGGKMFLLAPANSPALQAARNRGFDIPKSQGKWVGRILFRKEQGGELFDFLLDRPELYYVVDPPKSGIIIDPLTQCKKLVFSSPHRLDENSLKNDSYMMFMPVWTYEELKKTRDIVMSELSDEELSERFEIFGGVVRHVLDKDYISALQFFEQNIGSLTAGQATNVLDPYSQNKDAAGLFVHIVTVPPFNTSSVQISTNCVRKYINLQVQLSENYKMESWAKVLNQIGFAAASGTILEQCWHNTFALQRREIPGCTLRELGVSNSIRNITVPKFEHLAKTFPDNKMYGLNELKENQYCVPLTDNFETFDSFAALKKPFCCQDKTGLCLVGFQMTVQEQGHDLKYAGGLRVKQKVNELFKCNLQNDNMFVVFITTRKIAALAAWQKKQKWMTQGIEEGDGVSKDRETKKTPKSHETKLMDKVRQFVLVLPDNL